MSSDERRYVSREVLISLLGEDGAARVVAALGGNRVYIPSPDAAAFAPLARKLGERTARALCVALGESQVVFPQRLVATRQKILRLRSEMMTVAEIARHLGCSERYVYMAVAGAQV